jgi:hypothetical protein
MLVLVLQVVLDIEFGVFFQRLGPMEVIGFFVPLDWNLGIFRAIDDPYTFQLACALSAMKPLKGGLGISCRAMTWLRLC